MRRVKQSFGLPVIVPGLVTPASGVIFEGFVEQAGRRDAREVA